MPWIDSLLVTAATVAGLLLVLVNVVFFAGLAMAQNRRYVERWTKPLVVASAVLLLAAVGVPVVGVALSATGRVVSTLASAPAAFFAGK